MTIESPEAIAEVHAAARRSFERAPNADFIAKLKAEAEKGGWWADVLADPKLLIALRGRSLNVYWRGQSLFHVTPISSGLKVTTHEKYLVDPALASQVPLVNGAFDLERLLKEGEGGFIRHYKCQQTLAKMKAAAGLFSGPEKTGCHEIAVRNREVIDVEIAFPGTISLDDGGDDKTAPRIDLAAVETDGSDARLVFWEAKHYGNGELRARAADVRSAPVCRQIRIYRKYLTDNRRVIEDSYTCVAKALVAISEMVPQEMPPRTLSPLIKDVARGKRQLKLGEIPKVGLIIFGFDKGQREERSWKEHLQRLKDDHPAISAVLAVGDAKKLKLPA